MANKLFSAHFHLLFFINSSWKVKSQTVNMRTHVLTTTGDGYVTLRSSWIPSVREEQLVGFAIPTTSMNGRST